MHRRSRTSVHSHRAPPLTCGRILSKPVSDSRLPDSEFECLGPFIDRVSVYPVARPTEQFRQFAVSQTAECAETAGGISPASLAFITFLRRALFSRSNAFQRSSS
jgi:hypothetical protein